MNREALNKLVIFSKILHFDRVTSPKDQESQRTGGVVSFSLKKATNKVTTAVPVFSQENLDQEEAEEVEVKPKSVIMPIPEPCLSHEHSVDKTEKTQGENEQKTERWV